MFTRLFSLMRNRREREEASALAREVFGTGNGRRVLAEILRRGGLNSNHPFKDPRLAAIAEGRRLMVLEILNMAGGSDGLLPRAIIEDRLEEALPDDRYKQRGRGSGGRSERGETGRGSEPEPEPEPGTVWDGTEPEFGEE